jgi:hypothetical protein
VRRSLAILALGLVAVLVAAGCGQISRVSECRRFVTLANRSTAELQALDAPNQIVPEAIAYDRLALRFTRFASDIGSLRIKDPELAEAVSTVSATMNAASRDCRHYARELREHDGADPDKAATSLHVRRKLKKTRTRVSQSLRTYRAQVARVNRVCQPQ